MNAIRITESTGATKLDSAEQVSFTTLYPGGLYGDLSFFIKRTVTAAWTLAPYNRIIVYNGHRIVWEGLVSQITPSVVQGNEGYSVTCLGYWGARFMRQTVLKPWADRRISNVWIPSLTAGGGGDDDQFDCRQSQNRQEMMPQHGVVFADGDDMRITYTAPTGMTIKRVTYDLVLEEGTGQWSTYIYNNTATAIDAGTQKTADFTGSIDVTFATPAASMYIALESKAAQTADRAQEVRAVYDDMVVYTETGNINAQEIAKDCAALVSEISTDVSKIGALTYSLVPFIAVPPEPIADTLAKATKYGDSSNNLWAAYVGPSSDFTDSKPGLVLEQQPVLTDYDYILRLEDPNCGADVQFSQDLAEIKNYYTITYTDDAGIETIKTPDDDATLCDTASQVLYGRCDENLNVDTTSSTLAIQYAKTLLARTKNLQWKASGDIVVTGYILAKNGGKIPASEIRAGKRIKIANYLQDLSGTGLTFLITATNYDDTAQTCSMSVGKPDTVEAWLARQLGVR